MNILIVAIHYPVASGRYIARAFRRLGHDVKTVGPFTGVQIWGMTIDKRHVWRPDYLDTLTVQINGIRPDLVVWADSGLPASPQYDWFHCPVVCFGVDNHVRDYRNLPTNTSHLFLAHHDGPALPVDDDNPRMTWLPCGYDPEVFTPSPIPMDQREYDVAMVGVPYPRRMEIVEAMRAAGLKVFAATGLLFEDYAAAYHNARISLCVSAAGDVAQRMFETAAMGCVVLSDRCADFPRLGAYEWVQYAPFGTTAEAVEAARDLLDGTTLEARARAAQQWAQPHTWDARCQVILDTVFKKEPVSHESK